MPEATWLPIPGYASYQASDDGQIRNRRGRVLSQQAAANGAMQVHIGKSVAMVHNLVARTFYGKPLDPGYRLDWANGDRADNRAENLLYRGRPVAHMKCLCAHGPQLKTHGRRKGPCRVPGCPCKTWREFWEYRRNKKT